jgi:ectoine hydroxylase-related dioxygenase (phytanoyl-CoA dioxygenase family)
MANTIAMSDFALSEHRYNMATRGYSVVPAMLEPSHCERLKAALARALAQYRPGPTQQSVNDRYLMHDLLCRDPIFGHLLEDARLQELVAPLLGASWIMYAFTSSSLPPHGTNYGNRIHVDSPRWVPGYSFNVGVMWALDDFTADNGATHVLPGSHRSADAPSPELFDRHFVRLTCAAGSMILFDGRLYHRAGDNATGAWRHALTLNACRSFMKQRFDWVRFIPGPIADALNAQARRIIGFDTRLPSSLEEFFLPEERRLYKPGQG